MFIEKEKIKRVIFENKHKEDKILENILYEIFVEYSQKQILYFKETMNNLATKNDIAMIMEMMEKKFEASDKRFEEMSMYMNKRFDAVDKRFEEMSMYMNKHSEAADKRFEEMSIFLNKRFEAVDKRFEEMSIFMNKRFEAVDKRFESVDRRFDDMIRYMDKRFDAVDKRFSSLQWFMGIAFVIISILMTMLKIFV